MWDPIRVCGRKLKCSWMHFLKIHWRCINAVGCLKKRHAPSCIHKMQAILSVYPLFSFLFFLSIGWYCGAGIFGLIGCASLSLSLALPTFLNNNNYDPLVICNCITERNPWIISQPLQKKTFSALSIEALIPLFYRCINLVLMRS